MSNVQASSNFFDKASKVVLDLSTTDKELTDFLRGFYTGKEVSETNLQTLNQLMNMRTQRASLISNLEKRHHEAMMSIIRNLR